MQPIPPQTARQAVWDAFSRTSPSRPAAHCFTVSIFAGLPQSGYNQCIISRIIYPEMRFRSGKTLSVILQAVYKRIIHSNRFWFFAKHSESHA